MTYVFIYIQLNSEMLLCLQWKLSAYKTEKPYEFIITYVEIIYGILDILYNLFHRICVFYK